MHILPADSPSSFFFSALEALASFLPAAAFLALGSEELSASSSALRLWPVNITTIDQCRDYTNASRVS
jgi:hypothetical protein